MVILIPIIDAERDLGVSRCPWMPDIMARKKEAIGVKVPQSPSPTLMGRHIEVPTR